MVVRKYYSDTLALPSGRDDPFVAGAGESMREGVSGGVAAWGRERRQACREQLVEYS